MARELKSSKANPMRRRINIAPWYWEGFYRRGLLSLLMRAYRMRHIPMPCMRKPWARAALSQMICPFSITPVIAMAGIIHHERKVITQLQEDDDVEALKRLAPAGSISPMSCDAAVHEFIQLCGYAEQSKKVFIQNVTMPFLKATVYEFALLSLLLFFSLAPTWFVYALSIRQTTYAAAIACAAACYLVALPAALKLFTQTTLREDPRTHKK
jgi:hypothetical protein